MTWRGVAPLVVAAALGAGGCGPGADTDGAQRGPLRWEGTPRQIPHPTLPGDVVLAGEVVNASLKPLKLEASALEVVDADGDQLQANGAFLPGYVRALMPRNRAEELPDYEKRRLGRVVELRPGDRLPLNVSWRGGTAAAIRYGAGQLALARP